MLEASDGREALDRFESHGREVDVVVTDVVMPYVSGPALAKALRARKPDMKVLYVSGYNEPLADEAAHDPLTAQLPKPVTRLALLEQVAQLLALTSAPPGATR